MGKSNGSAISHYYSKTVRFSKTSKTDIINLAITENQPSLLKRNQKVLESSSTCVFCAKRVEKTLKKHSNKQRLRFISDAICQRVLDTTFSINHHQNSL